MACPTCGHTMHNLGVESERKFWCPRCGTLKTEVSPEFCDISVPKLAVRVKNAAMEVESDPSKGRTIGIWSWESICEAAGIKECNDDR